MVSECAALPLPLPPPPAAAAAPSRYRPLLTNYTICTMSHNAQCTMHNITMYNITIYYFTFYASVELNIVGLNLEMMEERPNGVGTTWYYKVLVSTPDCNWFVWRRYKEFDDLRRSIAGHLM